MRVLADPRVEEEPSSGTKPLSRTCLLTTGHDSYTAATLPGINDTTVSQTLRHLRASQTVIAEREGRVVRYRLASTPITALLAAQ